MYRNQTEINQLENFLNEKYGAISQQKERIEKLLIGKHENELENIIEGNELDLTHFTPYLNHETKIIEGIHYFIETLAYDLHQVIISDNKNKDVYQWNDDLTTKPGELETWTHLNTGRILTVMELYEIYFLAEKAGLNIEFIQP